MKKIAYLFAFVLTSCLVILSCNKEISINYPESYIPLFLDEKAGTWKTIQAGNVADFVVATPKPVTDPAYLREIDSMKNFISPRVTPENKKAVEYWLSLIHI